jgi:hypothetical protein
METLKEGISNWLAEHWVFLLPPLIIMPGLADFAFSNADALYSDVSVTHYPNAFFLKSSLLNDFAIPLWSPNILSGYPFIAHPHSGIFYPPLWLALFFPLPLGLNLMVSVHMFVAGIAFYSFLRLDGYSRGAATLAGLAFASTPKLLAHYGAGQINLVSAVCLTPLVFWATLKAKAVPRSLSRLVQPGIVLAFIFFLDPRWAFYAGITWAVWWIAYSHKGDMPSKLLGLLKQFVLSLLITLPLLWVFLEFTSLSTRSSLTPSELLSLSMPFQSLLGFVIPQWGAFHEWILYPGILVFAFALFSVFGRKIRLQRLFWTLLFMVTVVISLGENVPGMQFLVSLPGFSFLRVPPRALFVSLFALSVLAAMGFETLEHRISIKSLRPVRLSLVALFAFLAALSMLVSIQSSARLLPMLLAATLIGIFVWLIELREKERISPQIYLLILSVFLIFESTVISTSLINFRDKEEVLLDKGSLITFLSEQEGKFRVYSPSYSLGQHLAAVNQLELADGVDPIQMRSYVDFFEGATGIPNKAYSSTQPPFEEGEPSVSNASYQPDAENLGLLNVAYVLSEFPVKSEGLAFEDRLDGTYLYRNEKVKSRAWLLDSRGDEQSVEILEWSANRIRLRVEHAGTLILSEVEYPGWQASADGESLEINPYLGLFRSVTLESRYQDVEFVFRPQAPIWGLPISIVTLVLVVYWPQPAKSKKS